MFKKISALFTGLVLSLIPLLILDVPKTSLKLLTTHPIIILITTTLLAIGIALIACRYSKVTAP